MRPKADLPTLRLYNKIAPKFAKQMKSMIMRAAHHAHMAPGYGLFTAGSLTMRPALMVAGTLLIVASMGRSIQQLAKTELPSHAPAATRSAAPKPHPVFMPGSGSGP